MNWRRRDRRIFLVVSTLTMILAMTLGGYNSTISASPPGLLEQIRKRGKIVVATEAAFEPFEFVENGKIVGFDEDVLLLIIKDMGVKLEQLDLPFQGILPGLLAGKYDFVCTALPINAERAARYAFTQPVATLRNGIIKRKGDNRVKTVEDIAGLVVGLIIPPSSQAVDLENFDKGLKAKGKGIRQAKYFQAAPDMYVALANSQVDVVANSNTSFAAVMHRQPNQFEVVGWIAKARPVGWVTRPEDTDLRDYLSKEIRKYLASGVLAKLQAKWFGYAMEIPTSGYLPPGAK